MTVNAKNRVPGQKSREMEEHSMKKRVCLLVALFALVVMGFAMDVEAAEIIDRGYCGGEGDGTNLTWTLDSDGLLVIEGQGRMKDWTWEELCYIRGMLYDNQYDFQRMKWHKYFDPYRWTNDVIDSVIVKDGVTNIGDYAFYECTSISNIDLPESLTSIGDGAFSCCYSLSKIDLPRLLMNIGEGAFSSCNFSSINLPESLTSISDYMFDNCANLSSIVIPVSCTNIGEWAFGDCYSLRSINLPKSLTNIGECAFYSCKDLNSIELPESLMTIDNQAFSYCESLISITLPESLTSIGRYAFSDCYKLRYVVLPDSLISLGEGAFSCCDNLSSIYIPKSIDTIYQDTFYSTQLKDVYYGGTKEQWNNINIVQDDREYDGDDGLLNATIHYADDDNDNEKLIVFVSRLYRNFLKREPDEKGLADWVDVLVSGRGTGAKVVSGFVLSPEYQANSLGNEEYVTALYHIIFNRDPDAAGLNAWIAVMENGCTNKKVLAGFINSDEFYNLCRDLGIARGAYYSDEIADQNVNIAAFIARLYKICLGRPYEQEGLDNWVMGLASKTTTGTSVVRGFFKSQEFKDRSLNDTLFVTVAYQTVLDREPDESGLKNWLSKLSEGYTRNDVLDGFLQSWEFILLCGEYGIKR